MVNLSKTHFGPTEYKLLEKGLTYIPTPRYISNIPILEAGTNFARRLKLAYHFRNSTYRKTREFTPKSKWSPEDKNMPPEVLETIEKINADLTKIKVPYHKNNLSEGEILALKSIRQNSDIILKPADKGSATVIMDKEKYINEGYRQLNDDRYYKKIENPIFPETAVKVDDILWEIVQKRGLDNKQYQYLKSPEEPRPRQLYMLPKIHKPLDQWPDPNMPPGRPIISDCSSESYRVAEYIDSYLKPLASKHDSYIKDTSDFLNKLKQVKIGPNSLIVTMDVSSMYTNIDHQSGLEAVKKAFEKYPNPSRPDEHILKLLELSLKNNDFQFNGDTFLQIKGCAMGKRFAPSYANLFMAYFETEAMKKCYLLPTAYFRFLDDIFCVWDHGRQNLDTFIEILNTHHPSVKLTANIQENSNDFLDVTIYKGPLLGAQGIFDTKIYFKPTDTHQLLHKASFHPKHTFSGIIKSQIMRFYRTCTQNTDFESACALLFKALRSRGYSARSLRYIKSETLETIKSGKSVSPPWVPPAPVDDIFTDQCRVRGCKTCPTMVYCSYITSFATRLDFDIRHKLNCNSTNIIYLIECDECNKQYVGQTGKTLKIRMNGHRADIENKRKSAVSTHFNQGRCSIQDFMVTPIFQCPELETENETTKMRLDIEQYFMDYLKTYQPYGLNIATRRYKDVPAIHFSAPYSKLGHSAARIVRAHYEELQQNLSEIYTANMVTAYSRNRNLKDILVSTKIRN